MKDIVVISNTSITKKKNSELQVSLVSMSTEESQCQYLIPVIADN
jgi:hypothetical protein